MEGEHLHLPGPRAESEPPMLLEVNKRPTAGSRQQGLTPDLLMQRGLFSASQAPAKRADIRTFQTLHRPKLHGMAEWLLQYESAHRRQERYLQQIKELRQQFSLPADDVKASGKPVHRSGGHHWRQDRHQRVASNQVCVLHPRPRKKLKTLAKKQYYRHGDVLVPSPTNNFLMAPRAFNNNNTTTNNNNNNNKAGDNPAESRQMGSLQTIHVKLPPIGSLDRNATDYEPIEYIAERNKLNLRQYLNSSKASRAAHRENLKLSVEDVCVQSTKIL